MGRGPSRSVPVSLIVSHPRLQVVAELVEPGFDHHPQIHAKVEATPGQFCGSRWSCHRYEVEEGRVALTLRHTPYCASRSFESIPAKGGPTEDHPWSVGINVTVSAGAKDEVFVVTRRSPGLNSGGLWHVTANEGVELGDFARPQLEAGVARALAEEVGLNLSEDQVREVAVSTAFAAIPSLAALFFTIHLELGRLDVTFEDMVAARAHAPDAWESTEMVAVPAADFSEWRAQREWTPWAPFCWDQAASARSERGREAA